MNRRQEAFATMLLECAIGTGLLIAGYVTGEWPYSVGAAAAFLFAVIIALREKWL